MVVDTTAGYFYEPVEIFFCTPDTQATMLTYLDAFTSLISNQLSLNLPVSISSQENTIGSAAVIDLFTIILDPDFDAQIFTIQVKSIAHCPKVSDWIVKKDDQQCCIPIIMHS